MGTENAVIEKKNIAVAKHVTKVRFLKNLANVLNITIPFRVDVENN